MNTGILIIAHTPLASALRECALHVYPEAHAGVLALDVVAHVAPQESLELARQLLKTLNTTQTLILTDLFGATPCNVAQKLADGVHCRLVAGVNLPMLLRAVNYRHEPLEELVDRALSGGTQCIMQVAVAAPQNQNRKLHDQNHHDNQQ